MKENINHCADGRTNNIGKDFVDPFDYGMTTDELTQAVVNGEFDNEGRLVEKPEDGGGNGTSIPIEDKGTPAADVSIREEKTSSLTVQPADSVENITGADITDANDLPALMRVNDFLEKTASLPSPNKYFHNLIVEGTINIIFGNTKIGKTAFVFVMAESICGELDGNAIYFDFELSEVGLRDRLRVQDWVPANGEQWHVFPKNLMIFQPKRYMKGKNGKLVANRRSRLDMIRESLGNTPNVKLIVIDNMMRLKPKQENVADAAELFDAIEEIRLEYGITIILVNHTTKQMNNTRPMNEYDNRGSSASPQMADNIIGVARSRQRPTLLTVKHIATRYGCTAFPDKQVALVDLEVREGLFGGYIQTDAAGSPVLDYEANHLALYVEVGAEEKAARDKAINERMKKGEKATNLANEFKVSRTTIYNIANRYNRQAPD